MLIPIFPKKSLCVALCALSHVRLFLPLLDNAIPIRSWFSDPSDTALLNLLPMLDALRYRKTGRRGKGVGDPKTEEKLGLFDRLIFFPEELRI